MNTRLAIAFVSLVLLGGLTTGPAAAQERKVRRVERGSSRSQATGSIRPDERSSVQRGSSREARRGNSRSVETRRVETRSTTVVVDRDPRPTRVVRRVPKYYRPVTRGTVITTLPTRHTTVVVNNTHYHCHDGIFYMADTRPNHYVVVPPPIGVQVEYIPSDSIQISIGGFSFYYYDDVWYDEGLTVVDVPVGGYIYNLPPQHEVVVVQNVSYYRCGAAYYRPFIRDDRTAFLRVDLRF